MIIHKNMSLRNAIRIANDIGVTVARNAKTELLFIFPDGRKLLSNSCRKDTPQAIVSALRQEERRLSR